MLPIDDNIKPFVADSTDIKKSRRGIIMKALREMEDPLMTLKQLKTYFKINVDPPVAVAGIEHRTAPLLSYEVDRIVKSQLFNVHKSNSKILGTRVKP
jgi:hypothetical protein